MVSSAADMEIMQPVHGSGKASWTSSALKSIAGLVWTGCSFQSLDRRTAAPNAANIHTNCMSCHGIHQKTHLKAVLIVRLDVLLSQVICCLSLSGCFLMCFAVEFTKRMRHSRKSDRIVWRNAKITVITSSNMPLRQLTELRITAVLAADKWDNNRGRQ